MQSFLDKKDVKLSLVSQLEVCVIYLYRFPHWILFSILPRVISHLSNIQNVFHLIIILPLTNIVY